MQSEIETGLLEWDLFRHFFKQGIVFCYRTSTDKSEFDFELDRYDIQIPADVYESEKEKYKQSCRVLQSSPESDFSLRVHTRFFVRPI